MIDTSVRLLVDFSVIPGQLSVEAGSDEEFGIGHGWY
jgi:hypothetical protein